MRFMLDTCAFIDAVTEPDNLGADVCALMEDYENEFCISIETIREVILKYKNKKVWTIGSIGSRDRYVNHLLIGLMSAS